MAKRLLPLVYFVCLLLVSARAQAQVYEAVGTRAQGMAGAFVAVADDASATWWNPAGLASGAYFSTVIERGAIDDPGKPGAAGPARRDQASGFALALPSLGLSYYHLRVGEVRPVAGPIGGGSPVRQDGEAAGVDLRALAYSKFGVTIGQSIGDHLVIASTLGLLHGGIGSSAEAPGPDAVDHATDMDVVSETHGDIDLGAIARAGSLKLGVNVKHMTRPRFGSGSGEVRLDRQARAGVAIVT